MKFLAALAAVAVSLPAFAHEAIICKTDDKSAYVYLNFDGNGMPLVTAKMRLGTDQFKTAFKPPKFPLRRQETPMTIAFPPNHVLVLGLSEKTALVSTVGPVDGNGFHPPSGDPDTVLKCCNTSDVNPPCPYEDN